MWYGLIGFLEWTCCKVYAFLWLSPRYFTQVGLRVDVKTSQAGWNSSECWFLDVVEKERQTPCIGDAQTCQVVSAWCNFNACHIWQAKSLWAMWSRLTELLSLTCYVCLIYDVCHFSCLSRCRFCQTFPVEVEITVLLSQASGNLRNLIEGNKIRGIPAPPSQILGPKWCTKQ